MTRSIMMTKRRRKRKHSGTCTTALTYSLLSIKTNSLQSTKLHRFVAKLPANLDLGLISETITPIVGSLTLYLCTSSQENLLSWRLRAQERKILEKQVIRTPGTDWVIV